MHFLEMPKLTFDDRIKSFLGVIHGVAQGAVWVLSSIIFPIFDNAAARGTVSSQCAIDNGCRTAHPCLHEDGFGGTVLSARATFHACVPFVEFGSLAVHGKNTVGTHRQAHATTNALVPIEMQGNNVF